MQANIFITMNSGGIGEYVRQNDTWAGNNFTNSFIKLHPGADAAALEKKLPAFLINMERTVEATGNAKAIAPSANRFNSYYYRL